MICPYCGGKTAVYRTVSEEERVWRYRRCLCSKYHRFRTVESMAISENGREEVKETKLKALAEQKKITLRQHEQAGGKGKNYGRGTKVCRAFSTTPLRVR